MSALSFNEVLLDSSSPNEYNPISSSGYSSAWLERLLWEQDVVGSNPATPINKDRIYSGLYLFWEDSKGDSQYIRMIEQKHDLGHVL